MTDLNPEGLEKAAEALYFQHGRTIPWNTLHPSARLGWIADARISVTAYLDHAHPTLTTVEELDALPGRLTVMDDDGEVWQRAFSWSGAQWRMTGAPGLFHTGGIPLPARVLHWGDR